MGGEEEKLCDQIAGGNIAADKSDENKRKKKEASACRNVYGSDSSAIRGIRLMTRMPSSSFVLLDAGFLYFFKLQPAERPTSCCLISDAQVLPVGLFLSGPGPQIIIIKRDVQKL